MAQKGKTDYFAHITILENDYPLSYFANLCLSLKSYPIVAQFQTTHFNENSDIKGGVGGWGYRFELGSFDGCLDFQGELFAREG